MCESVLKVIWLNQAHQRPERLQLEEFTEPNFWVHRALAQNQVTIVFLAARLPTGWLSKQRGQQSMWGQARIRWPRSTQ